MAETIRPSRLAGACGEPGPQAALSNGKGHDRPVGGLLGGLLTAVWESLGFAELKTASMGIAC